MFSSESVIPSANNPSFKKKLCTHFVKGRCTIGAECGFAHGKNELRSFENPGFKAQLCSAYEQEGICEMGIDCLLAHGKSELRQDSPSQLNGITGVINGTAELKKEAYKSSLCIHFMRTGSCKVGTGCAFAHGKEDLVNVKAPDTNDPKYKTKLCIRFEQDSFCPNGDMCVFAHGELELRELKGVGGGARNASLHKTSLCNNFTTLGVCPNGKNCSFAHGRYELRPVGFDGDFEAKIAENPKWKCTLCNIFQQAGRCNRTSCDYAHGAEELRSEHPELQQPKSKGNFKTVLCKNFQARGFCFHEDSCNFAHGEAELNQAKDALTTMKLLRKRPKDETSVNGKAGHVATGATAITSAASSFDQKLFAEFLEFKKFKQQSENSAQPPAPTSFYPSGPTPSPKNKPQNMQFPAPVPPPTSVAEMETQGFYHTGGFQTSNMNNSNGMHSSTYQYPPSMSAYTTPYGGTNPPYGGNNSAYSGVDSYGNRRLGDRVHSDYGY